MAFSRRRDRTLCRVSRWPRCVGNARSGWLLERRTIKPQRQLVLERRSDRRSGRRLPDAVGTLERRTVARGDGPQPKVKLRWRTCRRSVTAARFPGVHASPFGLEPRTGRSSTTAIWACAPDRLRKRLPEFACLLGSCGSPRYLSRSSCRDPGRPGRNGVGLRPTRELPADPAPASARTQTRSRPASTQRQRRRSSTVLRSCPAAFRRSLRRERTSGAERARERDEACHQARLLATLRGRRHEARPRPFHPSGRVQAGGLNGIGENDLKKNCHRPLTVLS